MGLSKLLQTLLDASVHFRNPRMIMDPCHRPGIAFQTLGHVGFWLDLHPTGFGNTRHSSQMLHSLGSDAVQNNLEKVARMSSGII